MLEQTITIVNNSGKIIGTGKQLYSIFKEAKGAYQEKKAQVKSDRALNRAQTFEQYPSRSLPHHGYEDYLEEEGDDYYKYHDSHHRRRSLHDAASETGSRRTARSSQSKRHAPKPHRSVARSQTAPLTEGNLKTHSEVSSTLPSRAPPGHYRSPYAETQGRDMEISRMDVTRDDARSFAMTERTRKGVPLARRSSMSEIRHRPGPVQRSYTYDPSRDRAPVKEIDMHLAYGNIPPDLEHRTDLDPAIQGEATEGRAKALVKKVELLLDEANCLKHSATSTITHLQQNPDAAAAVALSLAELSSLVSKTSPAFLGFLKGGSPAVFALLSSPQFLIGSAAVVGVTVVMFGGWKIVKRVKEAQNAREALAYQGVPPNRPAPLRTQSEFSTGMDEALVLDDELSTIESWRRGIPDFGENESADMELITPEADRARRGRKSKGTDSDLKSRKSTKTAKTSKGKEVPERKSSKRPATSAETVASSSRHSSRKDKGKSTAKTIEDGRSRRGDDEFDLPIRSKTQRQDSNMLKALFKPKKEKELVRA